MKDLIHIPKLSWKLIESAFFHSFSAQKSHDTFYLDFIGESITGNRQRWQHILLLDAMLCSIHDTTGLGGSRFDPEGDRYHCHHAAFYEAVMLALELAVENVATSFAQEEGRDKVDGNSMNANTMTRNGETPVSQLPFLPLSEEVLKSIWMHPASIEVCTSTSTHQQKRDIGKELSSTGNSESQSLSDIEMEKRKDFQPYIHSYEAENDPASRFAPFPPHVGDGFSLGCLKEMYIPWLSLESLQAGFLSITYENWTYAANSLHAQKNPFYANRMRILKDLLAGPAIVDCSLAEVCVLAVESVFRYQAQNERHNNRVMSVDTMLTHPLVMQQGEQAFNQYIVDLGFPAGSQPTIQQLAFFKHLHALRMASWVQPGAEAEIVTMQACLEEVRAEKNASKEARKGINPNRSNASANPSASANPNPNRTSSSANPNTNAVGIGAVPSVSSLLKQTNHDVASTTTSVGMSHPIQHQFAASSTSQPSQMSLSAHAAFPSKYDPDAASAAAATTAAALASATSIAYAMGKPAHPTVNNPMVIQNQTALAVLPEKTLSKPISPLSAPAPGGHSEITKSDAAADGGPPKKRGRPTKAKE